MHALRTCLYISSQSALQFSIIQKEGECIVGNAHIRSLICPVSTCLYFITIRFAAIMLRLTQHMTITNALHPSLSCNWVLSFCEKLLAKAFWTCCFDYWIKLWICVRQDTSQGFSFYNISTGFHVPRWTSLPSHSSITLTRGDACVGICIVRCAAWGVESSRALIYSILSLFVYVTTPGTRERHE